MSWRRNVRFISRAKTRRLTTDQLAGNYCEDPSLYEELLLHAGTGLFFFSGRKVPHQKQRVDPDPACLSAGARSSAGMNASRRLGSLCSTVCVLRRVAVHAQRKTPRQSISRQERGGIFEIKDAVVKYFELAIANAYRILYNILCIIHRRHIDIHFYG